MTVPWLGDEPEGGRMDAKAVMRCERLAREVRRIANEAPLRAGEQATLREVAGILEGWPVEADDDAPPAVVLPEVHDAAVKALAAKFDAEMMARYNAPPQTAADVLFPGLDG